MDSRSSIKENGVRISHGKMESGGIFKANSRPSSISRYDA
jgi:hypothetical protein